MYEESAVDIGRNTIKPAQGSLPRFMGDTIKLAQTSLYTTIQDQQTLSDLTSPSKRSVHERLICAGTWKLKLLLLFCVSHSVNLELAWYDLVSEYTKPTLLQCSLQPLSNAKGIYLTPDNIRYFTSFLHPTISVQDRVIHFGAGPVANEKLLEVPLGEVDTRATIIITVGLDNSHPNTPTVDSDFTIGISDGTTQNLQFIADISNYAGYPPCRAVDGDHDNRLVSNGTKVPAVIRLIFTPFFRYAACETAQEGGYVNTMTFNDQIDTAKPLLLRVQRNHAGEEYFINYLKVEIY